MKIAITGVTGFRNRGVEALVRPAVDELMEVFPSATITVATGSPEYDARRLSHEQVKFVADFYSEGYWRVREGYSLSLHKKIIRRLLAKLKVNIFNPPVEHVMPFNECDLLIVSGGDILSSDYGCSWLEHHFQPVQWAIGKGIPTALLAHSIGPFKTEAEIAMWKRTYNDISLITVREELSRQYLTEQLSCNPDRIRTTSDVAFLLKPDLGAARGMLPHGDEPTVAVSVSQGICEWTGVNYRAHLEKWVELLRMIREIWGARVIIIPHVQEAYGDDRCIATELLRILNFDKGITVFAEDMTAGEYKGLIGRCDMVIAERMHACIAGISTGICSVAIGYSVKAKGILSQVYSDSAVDASDVLVGVEEFIADDNALAKISKAWKDRKLHGAVLSKARPRLVGNAQANFTLIKDIVTSAQGYTNGRRPSEQ
jgi:colanic acid/amylovoran biosynthesis protein